MCTFSQSGRILFLTAFSVCVCVYVLGIFARDHSKNEEVEDLVTEKKGIIEAYLHLERYDMVTTYVAYNAYVQVSENRFYLYISNCTHSVMLFVHSNYQKLQAIHN